MDKVYILFCTAIAIVGISGCAMQGTNISKNGIVTIERKASEKVSIPWADAYQDENDLIITGVVEQRCQSASVLKTHVNIEIVDEKGGTINQSETQDIYVPRWRSGKGIRWVRFKAVLPLVLQEGSKIELIPGQD